MTAAPRWEPTDQTDLLAFSEDVSALLRSKLLSSVDITDAGCWEYRGHRSRRGYCNIGINGQQLRVHRVSYVVFREPFSNAALICHHCDNPPCCNPEHLFVGTHKSNALDASAKGRLSTPGPRGEAHAFVTVPDVRATEAIRRHLSGESQRAIARELGVCQQTVSNWVRGKTRPDLVSAA